MVSVLQSFKSTFATDEDTHYLFSLNGLLRESLPTINGVAKVVDIKRLIQEVDETGNERSVYVQELNIANDSTKINNVTTRYFLPFEGELNATSKIAGGNKKNDY